MSFEEKNPFTFTITKKPNPLPNTINGIMAVGLLSSVLTLSACSQPTNSKQPPQQKAAAASQTVPVTTATASTIASTTASSTTIASSVASTATATATAVSNVSQKFTGNSEIENRLKKALPEIPFSVDNLSAQAISTNEASFGNKSVTATGTETAQTLTASATKSAQTSSASATSTTQKQNADTTHIKINTQQALYTKIQALLNWHQFGVGAVDGKWGKNTVKAMQAFQQARNLPVTTTMNEQTWQALSDNPQFNAQPVLVNYTLTDADINQPLVKIPNSSADKAKLNSMGYERITEALAEKFHIDEQYLKALNPKATYQVGETITVFNPGQPNLTAVARVVADKTKQQLYAYDAQDTLIAVYPTTVGSSETPSPTGTHEVKNRVLKPNYTHTSKDKKDKDILQPGPNNPVGMVWIGLDKDGYGIHGSPDPEAISRQASQGCIRLTNWDALALYGTIQDGAKVEFK